MAPDDLQIPRKVQEGKKGDLSTNAASALLGVHLPLKITPGFSVLPQDDSPGMWLLNA